MQDKKNIDDELRFQNELKKLKLTAETGAAFFGDGSSEITPNIESQFLNNIIAFEKAAEKKEIKKISHILGNPDFPGPSTLTGQNIALHLKRAYDLLAENNIALDAIYNVPDEEIYRFIIEDLFEYEMSVIDMPGMVTQFIYEEFYPNNEEDLKKYASEFVSMLYSRDFEFMEGLLSSDVKFRDQSCTSAEFIQKMADLMNDRNIDLQKIEIVQVDIKADNATVIIKIQHLDGQKLDASLGFKHDYGYWYVCSLICPNL
jgi:hypothetical protein